MPYLLDMTSRVVTRVDQVPGDISKWKIRVSFNVKRPLSDWHPHEFEWEDCSCGGLLNIDENLVIVQTKDNAYDIEYYTREGALSYELRD
jgi:hypothetical protein